MTVSELRTILDQCSPHADVLVRLDDAALDNPQGLVFEILGYEYSYGCTESLALALECGQPAAKHMSDLDKKWAREVFMKPPFEEDK
jgi:hypothetical protein